MLFRQVTYSFPHTPTPVSIGIITQHNILPDSSSKSTAMSFLILYKLVNLDGSGLPFKMYSANYENTIKKNGQYARGLHLQYDISTKFTRIVYFKDHD